MAHDIQRELDFVAVNPLFADVLAGEFQPRVDTSGGNQTLGRLMVDSYQFGHLMEVTRLERDFVAGFGHVEAYQYVVPWAGATIAKTFVRIDSRASNTPHLTGLELKNDDLERTLGIAHTATALRIEYGPHEGGVSLSFKFASDAARIRGDVTAEAQAFFEQETSTYSR